MPRLTLSQDQEADELLSSSPLALLIGVVLDQQIALEKAFTAPLLLSQRLGEPLDARKIALMETDRLEKLFSLKPALHRYPSSMARRVQDVCIVVAEEYGNDASRIWREAENGKELYKRIKKLPGFGEMKAKIFIALLGKQLGLDVPNWREASAPFSEAGSYRSIADIRDKDSLSKVREYKAQMKAQAKANR